jgi:hypothetical protein
MKTERKRTMPMQTTEEYFLEQIKHAIERNEVEKSITDLATKALKSGALSIEEIYESGKPAMQTLSVIFLRLSEQFMPPAHNKEWCKEVENLKHFI